MIFPGSSSSGLLTLFYPPIQGGFTASFILHGNRIGCSTRQFRGDSQRAAIASGVVYAVLPANSGGIHSKLSDEFKKEFAVLPANSGGIHSIKENTFYELRLFYPPIQGGFTAMVLF